MNRRAFLKSTAVGVGSLLIPAQVLKSESVAQYHPIKSILTGFYAYNNGNKPGVASLVVDDMKVYQLRVVPKQNICVGIKPKIFCTKNWKVEKPDYIFTQVTLEKSGVLKAYSL